MVTHIQFHRSCIGGATPDVNQLLEGEPAVNLTDKKMWVRGCSAELVNFVGGETASLGSLLVDGSLFASDVTKMGLCAGANISLATSTVGNEKRITITNSGGAAASVAGSDTEVQFNANSGFSADSVFVYNETANRLGVNTSSPRSTIEAGGVVMGAGFSGATGIFSTGITLGDSFNRVGKIWSAGQNIAIYALDSLLISGVDDSNLTVNPDNRNIDFRVDGNNKNTVLFVDAGTDRVGINESSPDTSLHVQGNIKSSNGIQGVTGYVTQGWGIGTNGLTQLGEAKLVVDGTVWAGGFSGATGIFDTGITLGNAEDVSPIGNIWIPSGNGPKLNFHVASKTPFYIYAPSIGPGSCTINEGQENINFVVDGDNKTDLLVADVSADKVGILTASPTESLEVKGNIKVSGGFSGPTGAFSRVEFPDGTTFGSTQTDIIGINVDNGTSVLTTGKKGHRVIPYDCEVIEWTVTSNDTGSITWDVNWCTYANWATTASVGGSGLPSLSSANKNQDTSVDWTKKSFSAGDIIEFEIDSVTTCTDCTVSLKIRRNG